MSFDLGQLVLVSCCYLLTLFLCAWATDKGFIPKKIVHHPAIYVLSLGIFASSWAYYGSLGIAYDDGYVFLAFYFGLSGAFLLAPVLLAPILRITSTYQLSSLADLFAFRFRSPTAGILSTLLLLVISLPLVALQIQAVSGSIHLLTNDSSPERLAIIFCVLVTLFTLLFGTRQSLGAQHRANSQHNQGLVFAIAFESLLKLVVMTVLGFVVVFQVFDGPAGLNLWLETTPEVISRMDSRLEDGPWRTTLLMFFASAIVVPHMFHMTFSENRNPRFLNSASWGLPLFLLLLSFSTPLILWAGIKLGSDIPAEYFPLAIGAALNQPWLMLLAYIGGLSAATGVTAVTTLALSSMLINHIILPLYQSKAFGQSQINIYHWLLLAKRVLVIALIASSYGFYRMMGVHVDIYNLGIVAYVGALQLLPATLSTLYWAKANHYGVICGIGAGMILWFVTLMLPLSTGLSLFPVTIYAGVTPGENWYIAAASSLAINALVMFVVSKLTIISNEERSAAEVCLVKPVGQQPKLAPLVQSTHEFLDQLSLPLGSSVAKTELTRALNELNMRRGENRPQALRRLRDRVETNLSGLMGPTVAHEMVQTHLPLDTKKTYGAKDIYFIESKLETYRSRLTGLASELDGLRRYHKETLNSLPMAVCSVDNLAGGSNEVMLWNQAMGEMTGICAENVIGMPLNQIPSPWNQLLSELLDSNENHLDQHTIDIHGVCRYFNLHKADIETSISGSKSDQVMLLEDQTETKMLEEQLFHNERLASIGQLAAGVAHEIGNPITGIDCLAQELNMLSDNDDIQRNAQQIREQTRRITQIVHSLVMYAHTGQKNQHLISSKNLTEPVEIFSCVQEAISLLQLSHENDRIEFNNQCDAEHKVQGNTQKLQQVFLNLLKNATDATTGEGSITVSTSSDSNKVSIYVDDQGHGIPEHLQKKLFEPFFTTKEAGKGTGLGLALAWNIIKEHFGSIKVISPLDPVTQKGTRFVICLPGFKKASVVETDNTKYSPNVQGETV